MLILAYLLGAILAFVLGARWLVRNERLHENRRTDDAHKAALSALIAIYWPLVLPGYLIAKAVMWAFLAAKPKPPQPPIDPRD